MGIAYQGFCEIKIDGKPLRDQSRIISLRIQDTIEDSSDGCELELEDSDGLVELPQSGVKLQVSLGYRGDLHEYGEYVADDLSVSSGKIAISATGFNKNLGLKTIRSQSYGKSLNECLQSVCSRNNITLFISDDLKKVKAAKTFVQENESDLHFLTRTLRSLGSFYKVDGSRLLVYRGGNPGTVSNSKGLEVVSIGKHDVMPGWIFAIELRNKYESAQAKVWNIGDKKSTTVTVGNGEPVLRLKTRFNSEAEAKTQARSALDACRLEGQKFRFSVPGNPFLRANSPIKVSGFKDGLDGDYIAKEETHEISGKYITSVQAVQQIKGDYNGDI